MFYSNSNPCGGSSDRHRLHYWRIESFDVPDLGSKPVVRCNVERSHSRWCLASGSTSRCVGIHWLDLQCHEPRVAVHVAAVIAWTKFQNAEIEPRVSRGGEVGKSST